MYTAKESRNKKITIFKSAFNKEVQENFKIKNSLRNAILMNELFVEYQPMFDIEDQRIIAVEALLRWNYNNSKLIPPSTFIPIAEKNGLIFSIGEWVLEKSCEQNKAWHDMGYTPLYMSVNVSILQLEQSNFPFIVESILKKTGLSSKFLELEITETIFTKDYDRIVKTIQELKKLGVKIVIDDFGTGYSSLGKLSELEINKLKIDKSFIDGVDENVNKSKIVRAIISMAKSLNLELTAEGVEKDGQLDFLRKNGCSVIQGYIFSKPVSEKSIQQLLGKSLK
jgi:EAL domain-containing protein (putative c-di-GMP-specific phosphodiesterase class I)